jgi:RND family efflux transporter MFP subunit
MHRVPFFAMNMKKAVQLLPWLIPLAVLTACEPPKQPAPPPPPRVTVAHPRLMTETNWDEYPGHVEAVEEVQVRSRVSGYIDSIHFQDGAEVKAGDLLFVIDPKPYQAELERAQANRQQAETHLELTRNDLKRAETLRGTRGAISEEELDIRAKAARETEDALGSARAAEAAAQLNVDYTRITAPIAGRISRRLITAGNLVQAGGLEPLTTLVSVAPIYCYFDVPEEAFLQYRATAGFDQGGQAGSLLCELKLANESGYVHRGHVDFFDNQVNSKTGTIQMRGVFANEDRALISGIFATARVPAGPAVQALMVPDVAIGADQNYKFVYIVNSTNTVETRTVKIGRADGTLRAVLEGLTPEDRVIVNGLMMARRGALVEPQEAAAAVPEPGAAPAPAPAQTNHSTPPPRQASR